MNQSEKNPTGFSRFSLLSRFEKNLLKRKCITFSEKAFASSFLIKNIIEFGLKII